MLINLRNALMAGKKSPLPPGARFVEYLESTGTQWIDTGVSLKFPMGVDMTLAMVSPYGTMEALPVFGLRYGHQGVVNSRFAIWFSRSAMEFALNYGSYDSGYKPPSVLNGQVVNLRVSDGAKLYLDGTLVADGGATTATDATETLLLYQMRDGSSVAARGQCVRYCSCKIYDDNSFLVRDFAPIAIGNTGYMLDLVSGEYLPYGNAGTGDFVVGPDKN